MNLEKRNGLHYDLGMSAPLIAQSPVDGDRSKSPIASWIARQPRSILREMVTVVSRPGMLSLAGGLPAVERFPSEEISASTQRVLKQDPRALQYGGTWDPLREHVVKLAARRGISCTPEQVIITQGAQQALDILSRLFVSPGDLVAIESICYTGIQQALAPRDARLLLLSSDLEQGMAVAELRAALEGGARPRFLYVISDAHNPLGVSLSEARRSELAALAHKYDLMLVEDDAYGLLAYDGAFAPPLRALAPEQVCYAGSFSKILAPSLRLGYIIVPEGRDDLTERIQIVKEGMDLESSHLMQRVVADVLDHLDFDAHLARLHQTYSSRRDALLGALARHLPDGAQYSRPLGGMFVYLELSPELLKSGDTEALLYQAIETEQLAFIPGHAFAADLKQNKTSLTGRNAMRLSFSTLKPELMDQAIAKLARCLAA